MKVNHKVLSIPPYISTSWKNISSLQSHAEGERYSLVIHLQDGSRVLIPDLDAVVVQAIFGAHAKYIEAESKTTVDVEMETRKKRFPVQEEGPSIKFFEIENISSMMNHNEQERNALDLPSYILGKIREICLEMGLSGSGAAPADPSCNCPFCQIARSIQKTNTESPETIFHQEEEPVTEKDLNFTSWIIQPLQQNLYEVIHPDDRADKYQVFLGSPIGCTCGSNHCEHIKAVLSS